MHHLMLKREHLLTCLKPEQTAAHSRARQRLITPPRGVSCLDEPTLFVTTAVAVALSGILLWIARPPGRQLDPLSIWALGMGCGAAGLLLVATAGRDGLGNDLAKALLLLGVGVSWTAARGFAGQTAKPFAAVAGAVVWLIVLRLPLFETSESARLALSCGIGSVYTVATALALRHVEPLRARRPTLLLLGAHASLYAVRAGLAASGLDANHDGPLTTVMLLEAQIHTISIAFLLLAMTKQRAEAAAAENLAVAENAAEARKRFLAQLSHEIRTPLNGILGLTQLLRRDSTLRAAQRQNVETLEAAGRHLIAVVNDSLDLARIDAGQVELVTSSFSPAVAAEGCLALVRPAAVEKRISLRLSIDPATPPIVCGDSTRLQQILLNLLWNALKFTPDGGRVALRVGQTASLCFEVSDTGPGVPPAERDRLFQDFAPLDRNAGGSGLGLAISARLAAWMGGRLSYHCGTQGVGSLFRLEVPWRAPLAGVVEPQPSARLRAGRLHVLVVDDVTANRFVLRAMLAAEGHSVAEASNCSEALASLRRELFDTVLLDLRMPGTDGIATARRIRALPEPRAATVPLLAVSADAAPETLQACLDAGMSGLVTKPIERATLLAELHRLELHRQRLVPID
jgi:signal transduction histidine kinase/ActR/RegA family two-component response regulator